MNVLPSRPLLPVGPMSPEEERPVAPHLTIIEPAFGVEMAPVRYLEMVEAA